VGLTGKLVVVVLAEPGNYRETTQIQHNTNWEAIPPQDHSPADALGLLNREEDQVKHLIWWLLCRLGYHDWSSKAGRSFTMSPKGHGKNRQVREWSVRRSGVFGCWKCTWKPETRLNLSLKETEDDQD